MAFSKVVRRNLFDLSVDSRNQLFDQTGAFFNVAEYSRFKYGQQDIGQAYGLALAKLFVTDFPQVANSDDKIVVSGPSYKFLSTASHGIVKYFCLALNAYRVMRGHEPAYELHSIRSTVGSDAYAIGDAAVRATHLAKSKYHIDTEMVRGSRFIFIDDVNVTGATEQRTLDRTIPCGPIDIYCLHVAAIDPQYAQKHAAIENAMNKAVPLDLSAIVTLITESNFRLNTRVFRSIMEWNDLAELEQFFCSVSDALLLEMYTALVSGTVEMYGRFPEATQLLETVLSRRTISPKVA